MLLILQTDEVDEVVNDMIRFNAAHRDCFKAFADVVVAVSFNMKLILILPPTQMTSACIVSSLNFVRTLTISEIASV